LNEEDISITVHHVGCNRWVRRFGLSLVVKFHISVSDFWTFLSFILWRCDPKRAMASFFLRFLDHTQRRTTVGRIPLDEWSVRYRDLYLTKHNTHNRRTSMHRWDSSP